MFKITLTKNELKELNLAIKILTDLKSINKENIKISDFYAETVIGDILICSERVHLLGLELLHRNEKSNPELLQDKMIDSSVTTPPSYEPTEEDIKYLVEADWS